MTKRLTEKQKEEIVESFKYGIAIGVLSQKYNCTNSTIIRNLKKNLGELKYKEFTNKSKSNIEKSITKKNQINDSNNKPDKVIRTHRREMIIIPQFVGRKFGVYNGREFVDLEILPEMIGLYFGELAPTRTSPTHTGPGVGATKSSKFMPLK